MNNKQKKLYRSSTNRVFAGICGGIGTYMDVDPTLVRLIWVLLTMLGGSGLILYILMYFIVPKEPYNATAPVQEQRKGISFAGIFGFIFIIIGVVILLDNLDIFSFGHWWCYGWDYFVPGIFILAGIFFLLRHERPSPVKPPQEEQPNAMEQTSSTENAAPQEPPFASAEELHPPVRRLHRSVTGKKILGVCSGLAEYFDLDVTIVRVAYVIFTILSTGIGFILYALLYLILPEEEVMNNKQ